MAKFGRRTREFFPRPSSAPEVSSFAHPIGDNPFCIRYRLRTGEKRFCARSRLRTEKNSRSHDTTSPKRKLCIFRTTDGENTPFSHVIGFGGEKPTRARGIFWALVFASLRSAAVLPKRTQANLRRKRNHWNDFLFPAVVAYTFFKTTSF